MNPKEVAGTLQKHKQWTQNSQTGRKADFRGACLKNVDFAGADLRYADFRACDLTGADLEHAQMTAVVAAYRARQLIHGDAQPGDRGREDQRAGQKDMDREM